MDISQAQDSSRSRWSAQFCNPEDLGTCCLTCCFPCITFGQIAEVLDEGETSWICHSCLYALLMAIDCHWLYSTVYREKLRRKYGLPAEPCNDCCVDFCCEVCALCQEHAELKSKGFDPSKGWVGPPTAAPPMPPFMYR